MCETSRQVLLENPMRDWEQPPQWDWLAKQVESYDPTTKISTSFSPLNLKSLLCGLGLCDKVSENLLEDYQEHPAKNYSLELKGWQKSDPVVTQQIWKGMRSR